MRRLLLALALLCTFHLAPSTLKAQEDRFSELSRRYAKNASDVSVLMDLAAYCTDSTNPQPDYAQAIHLLRRSESIYTALVQDKKRYNEVQKLIHKGITLQLIRARRQQAETEALQYVRQHAATMGEVERKAYLQAFPDDANIRVLLSRERLADNYAAIREENTLDGYYAFLLSHPMTAEADSAEAALARMAPTYFSAFYTEEAVDSAARLYPASPSMQQNALRQKSRLSYLPTCRLGTEQAYTAYLQRYPQSDYYMDILSRLELLHRAEYGRLQTPQELADFALQHSDDPLSDSALMQLRQIIYWQHNQAAARIYLDNFPLDEQYTDVMREYYSWFSEEGNRSPIEVFAQQYPNSPLRQRVQADLERGSLIDRYDLSPTAPAVSADSMATIVHLLTGRKTAYVALQRLLQPLIARRDWNSALLRHGQFDLCFEDVAQEEYADLARLLAAREDTPMQTEWAEQGLSRAFMHPRGHTLYFTQKKGRSSSIGYVRRTTRGGWRHAGQVHVEGGSSTITAFGFYDGGKKVLIGMSGDIWSAQVENDTLWTVVSRLGEPVNTPYLETDAYALPDGSGLLLASDRPGGHNVQPTGSYYHGDHAPATDLYFIPRTPGGWGEPVNLGLQVNTPYCERSPLLSRNMRTLYFVTDARGLGYGDVYKVTRTDVSDWTRWSAPVNQGKSVNGGFDESFVRFAQGERRLLLTSGPHADGRTYCYTLPTSHDTTYVRRPLRVDLSRVLTRTRQLDVVDPMSGQSVRHYADSTLDSVIQFTGYKGRRYALLPTVDWLYVPTLVVDGNTRELVRLQGYTPNELRQRTLPLPLPLVRFQGFTAHLLPLAQRELDGLARFLQQHASCQIKITVHADGFDDQQSYDLSLDRSVSIRNYLVSQGIDAGRILIVPHGNVLYKKDLNPVEVEVTFL